MGLADCQALDIAVLNPVRVSGSSGLVKHLSAVLPRWRKAKGVGRLDVFVPRGALGELAGLGAELREVRAEHAWTALKRMGGAVAGGGYDVVLCTTPRPVDAGGVPVVTMLQNVEPIQEPTYQMSPLWRGRLWVLRREIGAACRRASRIIAVSEHVKAAACSRYGIDPAIVDVIYHGFDGEEASSTERPNAVTCGGFLFCAGSIVPYRGYEDVIRALAEMRSAPTAQPWAVIAGARHHYAKAYERALKNLAEAVGVTAQIIWAGQLSREEMSWCYQNASVFVQTSRAEACPNIVLEALGHGCPVISCSQAPMPEILGDAAEYYRPGKAAELATLLEATQVMLSNEKAAMTGRGRMRAAQFSWDDTASRTLETLKRAARTCTKEPKSG